MKAIGAIAVALLWVSCAGDTAPHEIVDEPISELSVPAHNAMSRTDGYYREDVSGLVYLIRFFPEGNAVLINGSAQIADSLPPLLTPNAVGNTEMGWYNVPVIYARDSICLVTKPERGNIDYRGNVTNDSTLRFERYSHINGDRRIKEYFFRADP